MLKKPRNVIKLESESQNFKEISCDNLDYGEVGILTFVPSHYSEIQAGNIVIGAGTDQCIFPESNTFSSAPQVCKCRRLFKTERVIFTQRED